MKGTGNPRDRAKDLQSAWDDYLHQEGVAGVAELENRNVDKGLMRVLMLLELYCEASRVHKPARRVQVKAGLPGLGLTDSELPESAREADVTELKALWDFFETACHHGSSVAAPDLVIQKVAALEAFLMRWVPEPFADMEEIDRLLGESDAES